MWKYLVINVVIIIELILAINSSRLDRVMDRLKHVETRLNAESKFRDEDIASIIDRLDAIDKKLNESRQIRGSNDNDDQKANKKGSEEIDRLKKDVDVIKKAFREEKFEAARMRREIPKIETNLNKIKQVFENYSTSMLKEIETIKEYAAHSDTLMKRRIILQLNKLKMEQMALRRTFNDTLVIVKETNTKVKNNEMSVIELSRNVTRFLNDNTKVPVTTERPEKVTPERPKKVTLKAANTCADLHKAGETRNGVYEIRNGIQVFCDQTTDGGGWTVFQRRQNGEVDFYRNWTEYKNGFGDLNGEFWLGNEHLSKLTADGEHELRIEMKTSSGARLYAEYSKFKISPEEEKYKLEVSGYNGDAVNDSFGMHDGMEFSTYDNDNDNSWRNCAQRHSSGWWYTSRYCSLANLNGQDGQSGQKGIIWYRRYASLYKYTVLTISELKFR